MVAVAALVAFFLLIGLGVVAAAFAGRRRKPGTTPSRGQNGLLYAGVAIVCVAIGVGVPTLLVINNRDDADKAAVGGVDLTTAQAHGRALFAENCATCHTLRASNAVGHTGPNLDVLRPPAALVSNAIKVGRARGQGNMPAGLLSGNDARDVAAYVAVVAGR